MVDFSLDGDLKQIGTALWAELVHAAHVRDHEWREATLATLDAENGPCARTVVLREVDAPARELLIYTDTRSPKVRQLARDPRAELVCWSPRLGWQLRLRCHIEVSNDGLDVTSRWALLRHTRAAHDYLSPLAPGTALGEAAPPAPAAGEVRSCFAVMHLQVQAMDWLSLDPGGHRRALFDYRDGPGTARWLAP
jgi:hypothetical protein